jgi:hypothetical protein
LERTGGLIDSDLRRAKQIALTDFQYLKENAKRMGLKSQREI